MKVKKREIPQFYPVDKKYVHKQRRENVLLANLRRGLPAFLSRELVETELLPKLNTSEKALFLEYYHRHDPDQITLPIQLFPYPEVSRQISYVLFNIPHTLETILLEGSGSLALFSAQEKAFLLEFFEKRDGQYALKRELNEAEEIQLLQLLDRKDLHIPEPQKVELSRIFESFPEIPKEDDFFATMVVETTHEFFFEHPNEHVPGMMVIEAGRQMTLACCHTFGSLPLRGFQFILSNMNAAFHDYLDLHYPVGFQATLKQSEKAKDGRWTFADFLIKVFQNGETACEMNMSGRIIETRVFKRIRKAREKINPEHRFYPVADFYHRVSLFPGPDEVGIDGDLFDISLGGFRIRFTPNSRVFDDSEKEWECLLCFQDIGFVRGRCRVVWMAEELPGTVMVGFRFIHMTPENQQKLTDSIKLYCYIRQERGIV